MQAPAHSIEHLRDQKEMPARNWSFHLSQVNCISQWKRENSIPFVGIKVWFCHWYLICVYLILGMPLLPKEIPARNWSFHFSQVNCISLSLTFIVEKKELFLS